MSDFSSFQTFFVVTTDSLYEIDAFGGENDTPVAYTLNQRGDRVGEILGNGFRRLSIGKQLIWYIPRGDDGSIKFEIGEVDPKYLGQQTSEIVALFLKREKAMGCFEAVDRQPIDHRWLDQTRQVFDRIGQYHVTILICQTPDMMLLPTG